jgi:hypothetical protein
MNVLRWCTHFQIKGIDGSWSKPISVYNLSLPTLVGKSTMLRWIRSPRGARGYRRHVRRQKPAQRWNMP